jgi:hypothetical protein
MKNETLYFSVGRNGQWTNEAAPASFFTNKGATVSDSRIESEIASGIKTLWINGLNMGKLFPSQALQIEHLKNAGLI